MTIKDFVTDLRNTFPDNEMLSPGKSLVEYDYFDSFYCYPSDIDCIDESNRLEWWPEQSKYELKYILENRHSVNEVSWWSDVPLQYLEAHQSGITYLEENDKIFYFLSWLMWCYKGKADEMGGASLRFLSVAEEILFRKDLDMPLSVKQRSVLSGWINKLCKYNDSSIWVAGYYVYGDRTLK